MPHLERALAPRALVSYAHRPMLPARAIRSALVHAVALAGTMLVGCGPDDYNPGPETCDRSEARNPPVRFVDGTTVNGVYMTSAWDGDLLYFPGGMHYELEHHLGEVPRFFEAYLSFDPHGTRSGGTIGIAAGNQVELVRVNDKSMVVRNAECVDYWLIVVAGTGTEPSP